MNLSQLRRLFGRSSSARKQLKKSLARRKAAHRDLGSLGVELLEERSLLAANVFMNDNWDLVADNGAIGVLDAGDVVQNNNDTLNTGGVIATYGVDAFGTITTGAVTGANPSFDNIQEAIAATDIGGTLNVLEGTYTENFTLGKSINMLGAQAGVDARGRVATETILSSPGGAGTTMLLVTGVAGSSIDGFTFSGSTRAIESSSGTLNDLQVRNNRVLAFTNNGIFLNDSGTDITVDKNVIDGSSKVGGGGLFHLDTDNFNGFHLTNNNIVNGATGTGFFVDGNHNVGPSGARNPLISGNFIADNNTGMNLGTRAFGSQFTPNAGEISENTFFSNNFDGLQGGMQNVLITRNTFSANGRSGLALTSFGNTGADRGAQNSQVTENFFTGNVVEDVFFSSSQAAGTISTNTLFNNSLSSTVAITYAGTETIKASSNWFGTNVEASVNAKIVGAGAANVDRTPFLDVGTDTDLVTAGFQGSFTTLHVTAAGAQAGAVGRIKEGINLVTASTVIVHAGTYLEEVLVDKTVILLGEQAGVDARTRGAVPETIVDGVGSSFNVDVDDVVIDGFTLQGQTGGFPGANIWMQPGTSGTEVRNNIIQNNVVGIFVSNSSAVNQTVIEQNLFRNNTNAGAASGHSIYADQFTAGNGIQNILIDNNDFTNTSLVVSSFALGISNSNTVVPFEDITFSNNNVTNHGRGLYFFNTDGAEISDNAITGTTNYAIGIFSVFGADNNANFDVLDNVLAGNNRGIFLDGYAGDLDVSGNSMTGGNIGLDINDADGSLTTLNLTDNAITGNTTGGTIANVDTINLDTDDNANTVRVNVTPLDVISEGQFSVDGEVQETSFSSVNTFDVDVLDADDTVKVAAHSTTLIDLDGGPNGIPGDNLEYFSDGVNAFIIGGALITTATKANINHANFENISVSGNLVLDGTGGDDTLTINATSSNSGSYVLTTDGVSAPAVAFSSVSSLVFNGLAGDDQLVINNPGGDVFAPSLGSTFNGGTGGEGTPGFNPDGDKLFINGGATASVEHVFTNLNDGSVNYNGTTAITYTGLEPISDTITAATRTFTFNGGSETIVLADGGGSITSTAGETVTFTNPTSSLIINAGTGDDTVTTTGLGGIPSVSLRGNDGNDIFNVASQATVTQISVDGGDPTYGLGPGDVPAQVGDTLNFDANGALTMLVELGVISSPAGAFQNVNFRNIENLPVTPTGASTRRFDMNTATSPIAAGYTTVVHNTIFPNTATPGEFGWNVAVSSVDRTVPNDLLRDSNFGTGATERIFSADVDNGTYLVSVVLGDGLQVRDNIRVRAEGDIVIPSGFAPAGQYVQESFIANVIDGTLDLGFSDQGGANTTWAVASVEIRPANLLTLGIIAPSPREADGLTVQTYNGFGATPGALITIFSSKGTITTADASPNFAGLQVLADGSGNFNFDLRAPGVAGEVLISADDVTGAETGFISPFYNLPAEGVHIDFNAGASPTASTPAFPFDYVGFGVDLAYNASRGFGWNTVPTTVLRSATLGALVQDAHLGTGALNSLNTFKYDVPNGTYTVNLTMGELNTNVVVDITAEGVLEFDNLAFTPNQYRHLSFETTVTDGQLNVELKKVGGSAGVVWGVQGFDLYETVGDILLTVPGGSLESDGLSTFVVNGSGATPNRLVTVSTTLGTITTADGNTVFAGVQVTADGSGDFSFTVRRPTLDGTAIITAEETTGAEKGTANQVFELPQTRSFDMNTATTPTAAGFIGVGAANAFNANLGYGWVNGVGTPITVSTVDRFNGGDELRDLHFGTTPGTFRIKAVPSTNYLVTLDFRDFAGRSFTVTPEGAAATPVVLAANTPLTVGPITANSGPDGFLDIAFSGTPWIINGITVVRDPQQAAGGPGPGNAAASAITQADLTPIAAAAMAYWSSISPDFGAQLSTVQLAVQDLGGADLALNTTAGNYIVFDDDAAGYGWFVDSTPDDGADLAADRMDLLSVMLHEMGNLLGFQDVDPLANPTDLMAATLNVGQRRLPSGSAPAEPAPYEQTVDAIFAELGR
jgi:hypothetical protein